MLKCPCFGYIGLNVLLKLIVSCSFYLFNTNTIKFSITYVASIIFLLDNAVLDPF